jgi:hypothetical protein
VDAVRNPYRPGAGTTPPALIGRDELIDGFGISLRRAADGRPGQSVMPIGLRGVGKTVLLNRFAEIAQNEGFSVGQLEAPESGEFVKLLSLRIRRILLDLSRGPVSDVVTKALRVLKAFTLQLPDGASIRIDVDAIAGEGDSGLLSSDLTDLFVASGQAAQDRGQGLLIAVDEVQYLTTDELAALIVAIHRTTQLNLPVVLVGAGLPQLPGLTGDAKSYAERLFEFPVIGSLQQREAKDALAVPAADEGVDFSDEALDLIVEESHGFPYFLQEWGYHTWNQAASSPIDVDDVDAATAHVQERLDENFFRVRLDRLTPAEKAYLRAMAALGPGPHRSGDIATEIGVKVESAAPRRNVLIRKGMIYSPAHGVTAFTVPLFDEFLRRYL